MTLYINTSSNEKVVIGLDSERFERIPEDKHAQAVLPFILETLESQDKTIQDISEIEVATGPGSYTGLRVGVSVAQTLGWALKIPVNGILISQGKFIEIEYEGDS